MTRHPVLFILGVSLFVAGLIHDGKRQQIAFHICGQTYSAAVCMNLLR